MHSLQTMGRAIVETWFAPVSATATVVFFVGECSSAVDLTAFPAPLVCLNTPDTYPPQRKTFLLWRQLWREFLLEPQGQHKFQWFARV
jgi:hypothetical protein